MRFQVTLSDSNAQCSKSSVVMVSWLFTRSNLVKMLHLCGNKNNAQCVVKVLTQAVSSLLHSRLLNTVNDHLQGFLRS